MLTKSQLKKINQNQQVDLLKLREERYQYYGLLSEYQLHPPSIVNSLEYKKLNWYQALLFKRVLHGLNAYKPEAVVKLHWDKKRRISRVWKRGQKVINAWKQTICNKKVNAYLSKTFTGKTVEYILSVPAEETLEDYNNTMTFKELGINYEDVILKFLSVGLLPRNFFTIQIPADANKELFK
jgi:hypothetical protein|tara:strand:+ start:167 stop:712 length:546 start_codon:yes stop_codon:yes gene_type:complete